MKPLLLLLIILLCGCSSPEESHASRYQELRGRNFDSIYRIKVPHTWSRNDPKSPPTDTTLAICEFNIDEIRITIHNFPSYEINDRIPPGLQIARWRQQIVPTAEYITPQSFSGYAGFLFEASNEKNGVMGWIMQLGTEQYSRLTLPDVPQEWRSDITIKAQGPKELIQKHRLEIISFARSFELIHEIPPS